MRNHLAHVVMAVGIAALAVACGGAGTGSPSGSASEGGRGLAVDQQVKLQGCVQPASSNPGELILAGVFVPAPATQPRNQETAQEPVIANGTWVRLTGNIDQLQLRDYLGKRVEVTGRVRDTGANTLGTSGYVGSNKDKFDRSSRDAGTDPQRNITPTTAAPNGGDANGTAPSIAVEQVRKLSDSCRQEPDK